MSKVFVGLSGGVDSSVTAALLKSQGHDVTGVFIHTWQPDFIECTWKEDRLDAMRVAAELEIPFLECDAEEAYKQSVADYMISQYKEGKTPNPDILCNREIKFGVFWEFAKSRGAEYIATGHYARNCEGLCRGVDESKDQSYFLWRLAKEDLEHTLFPLGEMKKDEVRKLASKYNLPTARKKDSQGVCMLGDLDIKEFLSHYIEEKKGDVLNEKGEVIGYHNGSLFFTLGERHGFTITEKSPEDSRYYIVAKDVEKNTITVSSDKSGEGFAKDTYTLTETNWIEEVEGKLEAQIRYHGEKLPCEVKGNTVTFEKPLLIASGQSVVFYREDRCVGGGVVQ